MRMEALQQHKKGLKNADDETNADSDHSKCANTKPRKMGVRRQMDR